jgi:hypothetical protein
MKTKKVRKQSDKQRIAELEAKLVQMSGILVSIAMWARGQGELSEEALSIIPQEELVDSSDPRLA